MTSENVFNLLQFGSQGGTAYAPGAAAPATVLIPVEAPVNFLLDRAAVFPKQDRGRNVRNSAGSGFFGVRAADVALPSQVHFEDIMDFLEMHYAGGVVPTGGAPFVWTYLFEALTPTLVPRTIEGGNTDASVAQMRMTSCLIDQLTLGFPDIIAPGAFPWALSATIFGLDREVAALTPALTARPGLETVQGHLTRLYEGPVGTAFGALTELGGSLKAFTMTSNRLLARRAYGSASDVATKYGFKDMSTLTFEAKVGVSATSKSDYHDIWNAAAPASLGERRQRVQAAGTGTKTFTIDMRAGIMAVPFDDVDGERIFKVTGELVDDGTLGGPAQIMVVNGIASL